MITGASTPGTNWFLNGLNNIKSQEAVTQRQISSGIRLATAADSPGDVSDLIDLNSSLSRNETSQQNYARAKAELDTADQVISSGISIVESARTFGLQGANTSATPEVRNSLAAQVMGLIQQVVSLGNTSVSGRYIFSGDTDNVIPLQADPAATTGYSYAGASSSTRQVLDGNGTPLFTLPTAQQLFDARDSSAQPVAGNVLNALQNLADALQNNPAGLPDAVTALQSASTYLNQQQSSNGASLQNLASALQQAQSANTSIRTSISSVRDTDITQAATDLNMEKVAESASLAAQGGMSHKSLFDFIG